MLEDLFYMARDLKNQINELSQNENSLVMDLQNQDKVYTFDDYYYGNKDLLIDFQMNITSPRNIEEEWAMPHDEYIVYLSRKYGHPQCNYFNNGNYRTKNMRVERLNEGLFLHHLAEECRISLNELVQKDFADKKDIRLYDAKNFIYCNYIEHLLLHIKITLDDFNEPQAMGVDMVGAKKIWRELNKYYNSKKVILPNKKAAEVIDSMYFEYIFIMKQLKSMIENGDPISKYCELDELFQDDMGMACDRIVKDLLGVNPNG